MKMIKNKWFKGGLIGLIAVFGIASCSDDHFDLNTTNASGSVWENLVATHQVDSFAMILEKTIVGKKSYGIPKTLTYKGLLQSGRVMTVWAPKDGTYNAKYWLDLLEKGENELVETQFIRNHMANFNYTGATPVAEQLVLYNSKYATYDVGQNTFKDVAISNDPRYKNIASTNGTIHLLEGAAPFEYNLRELIDGHPSLTDLSDYLEKTDTLMFMSGLSVIGATVDGEIQYVDSFFFKRNKMMPNDVTNVINNEDSLCGAIIPSNAAFQEAVEKIGQQYQYRPDRVYRFLDEETKTIVTDTIDTDSLKELYTMQALFKNMFYSLYEQPAFTDVENATPESVKNFFETSDSLVSTSYYNSDKRYHQHAPDCNQLTEGKTPEVASNGYAFITDHFNFKANQAWEHEIIVDVTRSSLFNANESKFMSTTNPRGVTRYVTEANRNDSVSGILYGDRYQELTPFNATSKNIVAFNLPNVLAGTYDIYVVLAPECMIDKTNNKHMYNQFSASLMYDYDLNGTKGVWNKTVSTPSTEPFVSDPTKIDTILLFENFKFDYCYEGVPNCYPVISLTTQKTFQQRQVTNTYNINCFILRGKDE